MMLTRALRKAICRVLIGTLLFAQLAIAAYACPLLEPTRAATASASDPIIDATATSSRDSDSAMPCHEPDPAASALCVEHCRYGQQSADHAPTPSVAGALLSLLYSLPLSTAPGAAGVAMPPFPAAGVALGAAMAAPHAILHCCLRI